MQFQDIIQDSMSAFLRGIAEFMPNILAAIVILIVGWIVAKVLKAAVKRGLRLVKFPTLTEKGKIDAFLIKGGIEQSTTDVLGMLVYWLAMLMVLVTAANALGLQVVSQLLNQILLYIPNIIVAVIVVAVGLFSAEFIGALVRTAAANAGMEEAGLVATLARYALIVFAVAIALEQLQIGHEIVTNGFLILFGAAALAAALAVGLGAREIVTRYLDDRFGKNR